MSLELEVSRYLDSQGIQDISPREMRSRIASAGHDISSIQRVLGGQTRLNTKDYFEFLGNVYAGMPLIDWLSSNHREGVLLELTQLAKEVPRDCKSILDIGCGTGIQSCFIAKKFPKAKIYGIDLAPSLIATARNRANKSGLKNISFDTKDLVNLPEDNNYGLVFSLHVHPYQEENKTKKGFDLLLNKLWQLPLPGGKAILCEFDEDISQEERTIYKNYKRGIKCKIILRNFKSANGKPARLAMQTFNFPLNYL